MRAPLVSVTLLLLFAAGAGAQVPLTLDEAVGRTLQTHAGLRAAGASEEEIRARIPESRAGYLPRVDVTESWNRGDHPVYVFSSLLAQRRFTANDFALDRLNQPEAISNHRIAITLEQTVFDGNRTRAAVSLARIGHSVARAETERATSDLRFTVVRLFGGVLAAAALLDSARAASEASAEDVRRAAARRDAGLENEANVLALQVHAAEMDARRIRAESDVAIARARLNGVMGAPLGETRDLVEPPPVVNAELDPTRLEGAALAQRPELRQAALHHQSALMSRTAARAAFLPQVLVQAAAEANGSAFGDRASSWTAGVQVRWNVFGGGADAARLKQAAAATLRAAAERDRIDTDIRVEVRTALAEYRAALARQAAARLMVDQARESQRILRDRYDAGLATAADLLRAAEAVLQADATRVSAAMDATVTAAAIERATGNTGGTRE